MASENHGGVLRGIDRVFNQGSATGLAEGQLLRQFAAYGDEAAFEALLTRHGPMVLGVCRRLLFDPRTSRTPSRLPSSSSSRAGALRETEPLSPWLHGVAYRVAARIRARSARCPAGAAPGARPEAVEPGCPLEGLELRRLIDEEIGRLPEKYRRPVVLCYLEGQTHEQAARRLDCTEGYRSAAGSTGAGETQGGARPTRPGPGRRADCLHACRRCGVRRGPASLDRRDGRHAGTGGDGPGGLHHGLGSRPGAGRRRLPDHAPREAQGRGLLRHRRRGHHGRRRGADDKLDTLARPRWPG